MPGENQAARHGSLEALVFAVQPGQALQKPAFAAVQAFWKKVFAVEQAFALQPGLDEKNPACLGQVKLAFVFDWVAETCEFRKYKAGRNIYTTQVPGELLQGHSKNLIKSLRHCF